MRLHEMPSSLIALVAGLALMRPVAASFIPDFLQSFEDLQDVQKRCANPCGYYGQICCEQGESCYTDGNNQAQCGAAVVQTQANNDGDWQYITTTYVMTDLQTVTTTLSWQAAATTQQSCNECNSCQYSLGETPCGNVCCKSGQYCQAAGMCVAVGGGSSGFYSSLYTTTTINTVTAPARPTSNTLVTVTQTNGLITTTQGYLAPSGTNGAIITGPQADNSGGGLSGGAIAGIVIGVIAAIIILLLICACCCFKGLIDGLLGIFGLGPRRRRRTEVEEVYESRHHHGSRTGGGRTWFGTRPGRRTSVDEKKSGTGWGRWAGVLGGLGGLALLLGLKRDRKRRDDKSSSGYGSSYYSDYTSSEYTGD